MQRVITLDRPNIYSMVKGDMLDPSIGVPLVKAHVSKVFYHVLSANSIAIVRIIAVQHQVFLYSYHYPRSPEFDDFLLSISSRIPLF